MRHFLKLHGGAVVFYFLILVVMTFPLITVFSSAIPGFSSTDEPFGALWDSWRIRYSVIHGLSLKRTNMIAYPFGLDLFRWGVGLVIGTSFNHLLSVFTSPAFTWNAQVFLNFMLSAFLTYYLVYTLTRSRLSGVLSGLIFAFCPYQFARAWQHLGLTGNQWIVLMVFSCMLLRERPSRRSMGLFVLSCVLLCSFDYSVSYLGTIAGLTFVCYAACYGWREKRRRAGGFSKDAAYLRRVLLCAGLAGILLLPQFIPLVKNRLMLSASTEASAFNAFHRPFEDLFEQSARPLSYLLPSVHHPVFGGMTETFIGSRLYGTSLTEHTLYLGWTGLLLAAGAFLWWKRSRAGRNREVFYTGFFLLLACAAWSFSQPPWWEIGQLKILSPSFLMYKLLPMFRAYCRFGIVLMFAVAVLAGLQWRRVLLRVRHPALRVALSAALCVVVCFEFWNWPPSKIIDVSRVPRVYHWLKNQPPGVVVAEYPLDSESPNELYKFYQSVHEKPIINGAIPRTEAYQASRSLKTLSRAATVGALRRRGVRYVIVHHHGYKSTGQTGDIAELEAIMRNPELELVVSFPAEASADDGTLCVLDADSIDVYEIAGNGSPRI